jgi:DNA-directed RNA polymerase specialized sigma24 family protein
MMILGGTDLFVRRCRAMESDDADPASGAELAREAEPVRRWLTGFFRRRVREFDDVKDLVQDVFARIVARDSTTSVGNLAAYALRTATRVLTDRARHRTSRPSHLRVVLDTERLGEGDFDTERILNGKEDLHAATAALLSPPERAHDFHITTLGRL